MRRFALPLILLLALVLRILWLDKFPSGFTPDEASFGYDAYSILKTGKDQWGHTLPLVFESFGDYKAPLYGYLAIPFVLTLGLNVFSVRLPNALLGTFAVLIVYLLIGELGKRGNFGEKKTRLLQLFSALVLAISPWHIMMSRGAFEANLITFFLPFSLLLFFKGLEKPKYLLFSAFSWGITLFSYHSSKVIVPLVLSSLVFFYWREIRQISRKVIISSFVIILVFGLVTLGILLKGGGARASQVSIFQGSLEAAAQEKIVAINQGLNPIVARLLHNKYQYTVRRFINNYATYFSPQYLFTQGPAETTYGMLPGRGVLYWFDGLLLIGGLIALIKHWKSKEYKLIFVWLLVGAVPAALTTGAGYAANRAMGMIPALSIVLAFGLYEIYALVNNFGVKVQKIVLVGALVISGAFFVTFLEHYFIVSPAKAARGMLYGNIAVNNYLRDNYASGQKFVISRKLSEPHIYTVFVRKYDPAKYQENTNNWKYKETGLSWVDQMPEYRLDNYVFRNVNWNVDKSLEYVLIGFPEEFPSNISPQKIIKYPDGGEAIYVVDPKDMYYAKNN